MARPRPCSYPGCQVKHTALGPRDAPVCEKHGRLIVIELTGPQAEWVGWALGGPISEWGYAEELSWSHDITIQEAELAILARDLIELRRKGKDGFSSDTLFLPAWAGIENAVIDDLLNMLEDVAPDLEDGAGFDDAMTRHGYNAAFVVTASRKKSAIAAAEKIRKAIG